MKIKFNTQDKLITTTDLAEFGSRERKMLVELLNAWREQGLPKSFESNEVVPMMNKQSGCVFLANSEYQCAMMNGDKLDIWNTCGQCGHAGFAEDGFDADDCENDLCNECSHNQPYIRIKVMRNWKRVDRMKI